MGEVIENQLQHSTANGYDGTRQIADTTTSPKLSMKRQNQEYDQQLSQMITRRELTGTIKPYSRADYTPETEINQIIRQAQNRSKILPGVRQRFLSYQAHYEGNSLC